MNKVYRHRSEAIDEYLGRVAEDGRVYASRLAPDQYVGRVELAGGEIFVSHAGHDRRIGRVDPASGKVYLAQAEAEEYLGRVHSDGSLSRNRAMGSNELLGRVEEMQSLAHGGGAFLLLIQPVLDEKEVLEAKFQAERPADEADAGETAPA